MSRPKISVITICLNSAGTIEQTIQSVVKQTYRNIEYIIIDGGSVDGTASIIKKYSSHISILVSEPDNGIYDAMNKGMAMATGDWIHILNSDDYYVNSTSLERIVPHLDARCANYYRMFLDYPDGRYQTYDFNYRRWKLFISAYLPHPALIVSREQFERTGLFDTKYSIAADHDFIMRLTTTYPGKFIPEPFVVMRQGGVASQNQLCALHEMRVIANNYGMPKWLCWLFYFAKKVHWGV